MPPSRYAQVCQCASGLAPAARLRWACCGSVKKRVERPAREARQSRQLSRRPLPAGDVVFQKVWMLQAGELDGEAFLKMAHDTALHRAERDQRADRRPLVGGDTGARLRDVDNAAGEVDAVRHDQTADRVARYDTAVAAVFRQAEDVAVGEPGELGGELVALARGRPDGHRETVLEDARDAAFEPD